MPTVTNGYCDLTQLKNAIQSGGEETSFTPEDDINLILAIDAVSRAIDFRFGNNPFYATTATRYYTAEPGFSDLLFLPDDLLTITTLKTDDDGDGIYENTWATTDYYLEPANAALGPQPEPYRQIRINSNQGDYTFPVGVQRGIELVASWGFCTVANRPPPITNACILWAHRIWKRKNAVFGIAGTPGLGITTVVAQVGRDSDIQDLLNAVSRRGW